MRIGFISRASALKRQADKGNESTAGASTQPAQTDTEAGASGAPNGAQSSSASTDKTFTQAELEAIIEQRLTRAQNKAKAEADARALVEQGEWKTLAEQRAARVAELEPLSVQLEQSKSDTKKYRDAISKFADAAKANVPESVRALLDKLDPIDQLEWISSNAASLSTEKPAPIGTPQNKQPAKPQGAGSTEQLPIARVRF